MTDSEIIAVVQAHKEGKKIQGRVLRTSQWYQNGIDDKWVDLSIGVDWNFKDTQYRVAPEPRKPREMFLVYNGSNTWKEYPCHQSCCDQQQLHVREVLENEPQNFAEIPTEIAEAIRKKQA